MWARSERAGKKFVANEFCSDSSLQDSMRLRPHRLCTAGQCAANEVRAARAPLFAGPLLYPRGGEPTMETAAEPRKEVFVC